MCLIIGTAGHIDHAKTSLVKALTGVDTDRLKEEKERGISIELGFARLDLDDGIGAGIVDVPGHERFIRTMLAGAHGTDLVLFTVAADDGVMPQTEEHFDIIRLLGVEQAIFVITKADLATPRRIREVEEEIQILTSGTPLETSPVIPLSTVTGVGLEDLRAAITRILEGGARARPRGYFRLPVDRVFTLPGHGLIVTGTSLGGEIRVGDRVRCLPGNELFRVRSLQVHNQPRESAAPGQRVALNLSGNGKAALERGHVVSDERITDHHESLRRGAGNVGDRRRQDQELPACQGHLGTAERFARVILFGPDTTLGPKQSAYCQIVTSEPLLAMCGDHFIIRNETAEHTLGGGRVLHPWAPRHKRTEPSLARTLEVLSGDDEVSLIKFFLDDSEQFALPIAPLYQFLNRRREEVQAILGRETVRAFSFEGETLYTTAAKWQRLTNTLVEALRVFHAAQPLAPGAEMEQVRDQLPGHIGIRLFRAIVDQLEMDRVIARDANLLRLPGHEIRMEQVDKALVEKSTALLGAAPFTPPDLPRLERETGADRLKLTEVLRVMERHRTIVRVSPDLYFLRACLNTMKSDLRRHLSAGSHVTPGMFRDLFGTTRKYAIPLLEYLDREDVTVRWARRAG